MPLKLDVGLNRKVGEANFGSRGACVNIEMEIDASLVQDPGRLQDKIRKLFALVRSSLEEELHGQGHPHSPQKTVTVPSSHNTDRPATPSQTKALQSIARRQRLDLSKHLEEQFRVTRPEDLTLSQASQMIDTLLKPSRKSA